MIKDYMNMLIARGLKMPIKYFLEAHLFDIINKTDTHKRIVLSEYKYKTKNFNHSVQYQASWTSEIKRNFKFINNNFSIDKFVFFDIGCGKGKVIIAWLKELLKINKNQKLIGIDNYLPTLKIAKKNLRKIKKKNNVLFKNLSVLDYDFSKHKNIIFYLYNPFDEIILNKFLNKIYKKNVIIIYNNPIHFNKIKKKFKFKLLMNKKSWHQNLTTKIFIGKNTNL